MNQFYKMVLHYVGLQDTLKRFSTNSVNNNNNNNNNNYYYYYYYYNNNKIEFYLISSTYKLKSSFWVQIELFK